MHSACPSPTYDSARSARPSPTSSSSSVATITREPLVTASDRAISFAIAAAEAASDKLASDIVVLDVSDRLVITDCFVLASAPNDRQVKSVVDEFELRLRNLGVKPVRREGERDGRWVLLDFVEIVVHVQHTEERVYYALERLWKDCPVIPVPGLDDRPAAAGES